jgi:two-component system nitrate/nitrite sensor histidine kinase NarX
MRELICDFRTRMDPQGLVQALRQVVAQVSGVSGVCVELIDAAGPLELSAEQELQAFHIAREALANVIKHSGAHHARVRLAREQDLVCISVEDDGVGVREPGSSDGHEAPRRDHFGLDLMRERARLIGGRIELLSRSGRGTVLSLRFANHLAPSTPPTRAPTPTRAQVAHG